MSFGAFLKENLQSISGSLTSMVGFAMTGIAAGQLDRLLGDNRDVCLFFLGMLVTGLGGVTITRANSVTAKVRVAEAMSEAVRATPGSLLPPAVTDALKPLEKP